MLWDSVSFDEACTMHHTKNFIEICFNNQCDRLVSCGFETTKIWSIPSGQLLASVQNLAESKALTIAFAENDSRVIIGSDDSIVRYLHLSALDGCWHSLDTTLLQEKSPVEGCSLNCPSSKAFNKDITQIALAYRGYPLLLWSTNKPRLLGRCRRVVRDSPDHASLLVGWITAKRVVCNPIADDLVGLVTNGSVFKWNPSSDTTQEAHTFAHEIQISPDGKLFVTSDSNGTVKIWSFAYFSTTYQLSSEDPVTGLGFSPDCKRFYDLRGSSITAWEPNTLVRFFDHAKATSDTASDLQTLTSDSHISEARFMAIEPATALSAAPGKLLYCASLENGTMEIFDKTKGK